MNSLITNFHSMDKNNIFEDKNINLPDKLSDCILVALGDEHLAFESPNFKIDMDDAWYATNDDKTEVCSVCFAGAVMAHTLEQQLAPSNEDDCRLENCLHPGVFSDHNNNRLRALDRIREGNVIEALSHVTNQWEDYIRDLDNFGSKLESLFTNRKSPNFTNFTDFTDCGVWRYEENRINWRYDMFKIADFLKQQGY